MFWLKELKFAWQGMCFICFLSAASFHNCQLCVYHHTLYHLNGRIYGPVTELHSPVYSTCSLYSVDVGDWLPSQLFCHFPLPFQATVRIVLKLGHSFMYLLQPKFYFITEETCIKMKQT
jgi:hypothetical protein